LGPRHQLLSGRRAGLFGGESADAGFEMTFPVSARVRLDESYFFSRLSAAGRSVLDDHIARSRVDLQFARAASRRIAPLDPGL
jgi:hypothetical protein